MALYTGKAFAGWKDKVKRSVNHMEKVMGAPLSTWRIHNWNIRARQIKLRYIHPPYYSAWLCIHRGEGSWSDPNAPYWGGLQMDLGFQRTYGRYLFNTKGTANHWSPLEQIWTAEKARRGGRGFYPWPNTARYCGLI
jgi:hypothetical protein